MLNMKCKLGLHRWTNHRTGIPFWNILELVIYVELHKIQAKLLLEEIKGTLVAVGQLVHLQSHEARFILRQKDRWSILLDLSSTPGQLQYTGGVTARCSDGTMNLTSPEQT